MARDFREIAGDALLRRMLSDRCKKCLSDNVNKTCGAWICGEAEWEQHKAWHQQNDDRLDRARDKISALELTVNDPTTGLVFRLTDTEQKLQNARNRLKTAEDTIALHETRIAALELP